MCPGKVTYVRVCLCVYVRWLVPDTKHESEKPLMSKPDGNERYRRVQWVLLPVQELQEWMHVCLMRICTFVICSEFFLPYSDICELRIWSTVCRLQNQTKSETKAHTHPLHWVSFGVWCAFCCTSDKPPLCSRYRWGLVLPRTLSAVWHAHACAIRTAQGLITWHTYMTSSTCNQIHMSPSLLSLSGSISISRWNSVSLLIHPWLRLHVPLSVCFSFIPCPPLSLSPSQSFSILVHHLCFFCLSLVSDLSLGLSMGFAVKMERDFDCQAENSPVDICWPFMAKIRFYGHSLAEDLLFVVVMACCRVHIVVIAC